MILMIKHKRIGTMIMLSLAVLFSTCKAPDKRNGITVGVCYQNLQNEFIINIQDALRKKAAALDIKLIETDGQGKAENQIAQVENFISLGVNAIVLNPF